MSILKSVLSISSFKLHLYYSSSHPLFIAAAKAQHSGIYLLYSLLPTTRHPCPRLLPKECAFFLVFFSLVFFAFFSCNPPSQNPEHFSLCFSGNLLSKEAFLCRTRKLCSLLSKTEVDVDYAALGMPNI